MSNNKFLHAGVKARFDIYPELVKTRLLFLRALIFDVAKNTKGVGRLEETLKWGEPSYVTAETNSGSTVRIDWKKSAPDNYYIYFNCKTTLVDSFKELHSSLFQYGGNRSIIFHVDDEIPVPELSDCIAMALTYHRNKHV